MAFSKGTVRSLSSSRMLVLLLVAYLLLARVPVLLQPYVDIDEADFAVQTATWLSGGTPYLDFVEKKPPLIHALYAIGFLAGGTWNMTAVHLFFALQVAATGLLIALAARRRVGGGAGLAALALFAAYQAGYDLNDFQMAGTEIPMNLCVAGAALAALAGFGRARRRSWFALAGILAGLALLAKPVGAAFLPALLIANIWDRRKRKELGFVPDDVASFAAGCVLPIAAVVAWLASQGALGEAIRWAWTENFVYASSSLPLFALVVHGATRFGFYLLASLPLWVLAAGRIAVIARNRSWEAADLLLVLWLVASFFSVSLGWRFFPHYFLQFLPPLVLLAAQGWASWFSPLLVLRPREKSAAILMGIVLPMAIFPAVQIAQARRLSEGTAVERAIASAVAAKSSSDDRIFVWGHSSDIYLLSRRLPAARFAYCSFLSGASEGYEGTNRLRERREDVWRMLISDLARRPPAVIVDMSGTDIRGYGAYPLEAFPDLAALVGQAYREDGIVSGARLFVRRENAIPHPGPLP